MKNVLLLMVVLLCGCNNEHLDNYRYVAELPHRSGDELDVEGIEAAYSKLIHELRSKLDYMPVGGKLVAYRSVVMVPKGAGRGGAVLKVILRPPRDFAGWRCEIIIQVDGEASPEDFAPVIAVVEAALRGSKLIWRCEFKEQPVAYTW